MNILLLADENLPRRSSELLRELGYDIKVIWREHAGISDHEVVAIANEEQRIILTFDSDFGELVFRLGLSPMGVVYFRLTKYTPKQPGQYVHRILQQQLVDFEGYMTVITDGLTIRQRKL